MQEDLISFETAKLAKEKGFDISTHSYYFEDNKFKENSIKGTNGYYGEDNTINVHISNIRKKIKEFDEESYIKTVWGIGFKIDIE